MKTQISLNSETSIFSDAATEAAIRAAAAEVRERIAAAARRSNREPSDVTLVAVSKYAAANDGVISGFLAAGLFDLAENRPQKFLEKANFWRSSEFWPQNGALDFAPTSRRDADDRRLRWHFIGALQRNKIRRILPFVSLIHSVDSLKVLEAIDRILTEENERQAEQAASENSTKSANSPEPAPPSFPPSVSALLEVHISNDATKQGFSPDELLTALPKIAAFRRVKIRGLMGMAGLTATPAETRRQFAALRTLRDAARERLAELTDFNDFNELSMGMSGDFETAIEEGSTLVRIGSVLYPNL